MAEWVIMLNDLVIKRFVLTEGRRITIGRGKDADVIIDNTAISRLHTAMALRDGVHYISDLGSLNGTLVNGAKVEGEVAVSENDTIEIGKFRVTTCSPFEQQKVSTSYAAVADTDDETVFVGAKRSTPETAKPKGAKSGPRLIVVQGNATPAELALGGKNSIKIGQDPSCDLVVQGWFVAKAQCYIIRKESDYSIIPQRSWAATRLNGARIKDEHPLRKGDVIEIRKASIRFE